MFIILSKEKKMILGDKATFRNPYKWNQFWKGFKFPIQSISSLKKKTEFYYKFFAFEKIHLVFIHVIFNIQCIQYMPWPFQHWQPLRTVNGSKETIKVRLLNLITCFSFKPNETNNCCNQWFIFLQISFRKKNCFYSASEMSRHEISHKLCKMDFTSSETIW